MDKKKIEKLMHELLVELGEDVSREGIKDTPKRLPIVYEEIFGGMNKTVKDVVKKTFRVEKNDIIIEKNIHFYSMCEHDFLPFFGQVHISYIPNNEVLGFGDVVKIVDLFSKRLQIQERMTSEICDAIFEFTNCQGIMVIVKARHLCMEMKGAKKENTEIITRAVRGSFESNADLRNEALGLMRI
ncbi:MAG: GTP cyclohydrolase I FolE [Sebaldella sp.]|nr:GTP cyclohydrolase I FolE [Sebaldella sp.]